MQIVRATEAHVIELRRNLREGDKREIWNYGLCVRTALWRSFNETLEPKAAIVEGQVAGIWGVCGTVLGYTGQPWLLTAKIAEKYPIQFALLYRQEVRKMLEIYDVLENVVDFSYKEAIKLLNLCGFTVHDPLPLGPNGELFSRFEMRRQDDAI